MEREIMRHRERIGNTASYAHLLGDTLHNTKGEVPVYNIVRERRLNRAIKSQTNLSPDVQFKGRALCHAVNGSREEEVFVRVFVWLEKGHPADTYWIRVSDVASPPGELLNIA